MALYLAGSQLLTTPRLYREFRFHPHLERFGPFAAPVAGAAFGLGWTPCIGPVLAAVLAVASAQGETAKGASLLVAYSLGLGLPFLLVGLGVGRFAPALNWVKRHSRAITLVSAALLAVFGVILLLDRLPLVDVRLARREGGLALLELRELLEADLQLRLAPLEICLRLSDRALALVELREAGEPGLELCLPVLELGLRVLRSPLLLRERRRLFVERGDGFRAGRVRSLELLQRDDIGLGGAQPVEQIGEALVDIVNVEGRDFHAPAQ